MILSLESRKQQTNQITLWGVFVNFILSIIKILGGIFGHSQALFADGIHSLSDLASDAMVLFAAKHAHEDADEDHPYGHARYETLATVALGVFLFVIAFGLAWHAIERLLTGELTSLPQLYTLFIVGISILSKEFLYHMTMRVAKRLKSNMLKANAWHHRSDAISSIIVLVGIMGTYLGFTYLDAIATILVALMIAKIAFDLIKQSIQELVDTALEPELVAQIKQTIFKIKEVKHLHMLRSRRMGHNALIDVHVQVDPKLSVSEGHQISDYVSRTLINKFEDINDVTVHIDPEDDEVSASCCHLPLRDELMAKLEKLCTPHPVLQFVDQVNFHYLMGKIDIDAHLSLKHLTDANGAKKLQQEFKQLCLQIDDISEVVLSFS